MNKRTVLITGASRGIGKEIAKKFAAEGTNIIINAKSSFHELMELNEELQATGTCCHPILTDVSDYRAVQEMFEEIYTLFPTVDVLINNAGISHIALLTETSPEKWHEVISTNLTSVFNVCSLAIPKMIQCHRGRIINVSSIWGNLGASMEVAYSASKGGVNAFTKALAKEVGPSGILVNAIACGVIDTGMNHWLTDEEKSNLENQIALCRFGTAKEVADLAFFLASEQCSYLSGQIIQLDGCIS